MKIVDVKAYPTSYRVPKELQVSLGIGTMTKRDCVMVKVTTEDGIVGWGESHHARAPGSIGHLINTHAQGLRRRYGRQRHGRQSGRRSTRSSSAATAWGRPPPWR